VILIGIVDIINVTSVVSQAQVKQWYEKNDEEIQYTLYWRQALRSCCGPCFKELAALFVLYFFSSVVLFFSTVFIAFSIFSFLVPRTLLGEFGSNVGC
jgi:hypothetical protein